jgi:nucleoside-diphosphate-sugar epimerase
MKKILVTGSSGFIGQHLVPALKQLGHEIIPADRTHGIDLTKKENQMIAFNYKNLQPLWALDNLKKGAKYA